MLVLDPQSHVSSNSMIVLLCRRGVALSLCLGDQETEHGRESCIDPCMAGLLVQFWWEGLLPCLSVLSHLHGNKTSVYHTHSFQSLFPVLCFEEFSLQPCDLGVLQHLLSPPSEREQKIVLTCSLGSIISDENTNIFFSHMHKPQNFVHTEIDCKGFRELIYTIQQRTWCILVTV